MTRKLKKEGVVTLQTFFIALFGSVEYALRHSFGIVTGVVLLAVVILGNLYGRKGVSFAAVVTPPIIFAALALIWAISSNGTHVSRIGVDFTGSLASIAPWLITGALYGWVAYLISLRSSRGN